MLCPNRGSSLAGSILFRVDFFRREDYISDDYTYLARSASEPTAGGNC